MQPQDGEPVPDDRRDGFGREAVAPPAAPELVAHLGAPMLEVESQEPDGADHLAVAEPLDGPADRLPGGVALLQPGQRRLRLGQRGERRHVVVSRDLRIAQDAEERRRIA
jgi:hypothetical protein